MKVAISWLVGVSLLAGLAGPADAGARAKKKQHERSQADRQSRGGYGAQGSDYTERLADKLPFGSSAWWDQMARERRSGRPG